MESDALSPWSFGVMCFRLQLSPSPLGRTPACPNFEFTWASASPSFPRGIQWGTAVLAQPFLGSTGLLVGPSSPCFPGRIQWEAAVLAQPFLGSPVKICLDSQLALLQCSYKCQETGVGGNPWRRRGMEKQNCRAWCWQRSCRGAAGSPLCHSPVAGWGCSKSRGHTWALPRAASLWDCCSPTMARHLPAMQQEERGCKAGL